jgi:hypothetical protein
MLFGPVPVLKVFVYDAFNGAVVVGTNPTAHDEYT